MTAYIRSVVSGAHSGSNQPIVLLHNLEGFSNAEIARTLRAALEAGCKKVRIELPSSPFPTSEFVGLLLSHGAQEVHIDVVRTKDSIANEPVFDAMGKTISGLALNLRARVCLKIHAPSNTGECEMLIRRVSLAGAPRIVLLFDEPASASVAAELQQLCAESARRLGVSIDLRLPGLTAIYHSDAWKQSEAETLLLDVPATQINGETIPLGAVFQLGFKCSQKCIFCSADNSLPNVSEAVMHDTLARTLKTKIPRVVFTGGEPTMDPCLADYISRCKKARVTEISLYTNGMAAADVKYAGRLAASGLDIALVSLHSHRPDISDRITRRPSGFKKTSAGIQNLLGFSVLTIINFVINEMNFRDTARFVSFVKNNYPGALLNFSYVAPIREFTAKPDVIPRFRDAAPVLMEALDACDELGVVSAGLEPHWGIPPCAIRADRRYFPFLLPLVGTHSGFIKAAACSRCTFDKSCFGIRANYAKMYGFEELTPL